MAWVTTAAWWIKIIPRTTPPVSIDDFLFVKPHETRSCFMSWPGGLWKDGSDLCYTYSMEIGLLRVSHWLDGWENLHIESRSWKHGWCVTWGLINSESGNAFRLQNRKAMKKCRDVIAMYRSLEPGTVEGYLENRQAWPLPSESGETCPHSGSSESSCTHSLLSLSS